MFIQRLAEERYSPVVQLTKDTEFALPARRRDWTPALRCRWGRRAWQSRREAAGR